MIDIQSTDITAQFAIESVGVTSVAHPILARDSVTGEVQHAVAQWVIGVHLASSKRGTHMSRMIEELNLRAASPMGLDELAGFAEGLKTVLDTTEVEIQTSFTWFRQVKAPVTGKVALLPSQVSWSVKIGANAAESQKSVTVSVPAKALCPCSKAISSRGAHNQRSDIKATVSMATDGASFSVVRLMELLETSASSPVYPILKRDDEKYVTETAYDNPVFVEDIVRNVAKKLVDFAEVSEFVVEAINRESIHAHDCYARIRFRR